MFFIVYKGAKGLNLDDTSLSMAFAWALGLGVGCGLLMVPTVLPYMRKQISIKFNDDGTLKPVSEPDNTINIINIACQIQVYSVMRSCLPPEVTLD